VGGAGRGRSPSRRDLAAISRRTAGLSPSEARGRECSDLDSPAAGATVIVVRVGGAPDGGLARGWATRCRRFCGSLLAVRRSADYEEGGMRVTTALNRMLALAGGWARNLAFGSEGVIVTVAPKNRSSHIVSTRLCDTPRTAGRASRLAAAQPHHNRSTKYPARPEPPARPERSRRSRAAKSR